MKNSLAALALAASFALAGSGTAVAATYPPQPSCAVASTATVAAGVSFSFSGQCMAPNETITVSVTLAANNGVPAGSRSVPSIIKIATAPLTFKGATDARGHFSLPISIHEAGIYSVFATGDKSGVKAGPISITVISPVANVVDVPRSASDDLANTGSDSAIILWTMTGAGALVVGASSVALVRRRRASVGARG